MKNKAWFGSEPGFLNWEAQKVRKGWRVWQRHIVEKY